MYTYGVRYKRVIDGDTFVCDIDLGFDIWLTDRHCRLLGIDTPEKNTPEGKMAIETAKKWFEERRDLGHKIVIDVETKADKYGRTLVRVHTDKDPITLNKLFIDSGVAYSYFGGKKKDPSEKGS